MDAGDDEAPGGGEEHWGAGQLTAGVARVSVHQLNNCISYRRPVP